MKTDITSIDAYIEQAPKEAQPLLKKIRAVIKAAVPDATEAIKYGMPTFVLDRNLVHFAANKAHLGFYPSPSGITNFQQELAGYTSSKGAIQFPYNQPLPIKLIEKITKFRAKENLEHAALKKSKAR